MNYCILIGFLLVIFSTPLPSKTIDFQIEPGKYYIIENIKGFERIIVGLLDAENWAYLATQRPLGYQKNRHKVIFVNHFPDSVGLSSEKMYGVYDLDNCVEDED